MADAYFKRMVDFTANTTNEFSTIDTEENKNRFRGFFELGKSADTLRELTSTPPDQFNARKEVSLGAFSDDAAKADYDYFTLNQYHQEFPDIPQPKVGEHGFSRIPKGNNRGKYLKLMNHPTLDLAIQSDLHFRTPLTSRLPEQFNLNDYNKSELREIEQELDGVSAPHKIYTTEENGTTRLWSFPQDERVDSTRFKPIDSELLDKLLLNTYPKQQTYDYIMDHEIPNKTIPNKKGSRYFAYGDSGKDSYLTIGIGHLVDSRKAGSVERTARMLRRINPTLDVNKIVAGQQGLTHSEAIQLYRMDVDEKTRVAHKHFPKLHTYPDYMQVAIIDGYFWGMLPKSRKTRIYIKAGKLEKAREEWLDNTTYRRGESKHRFGNFNKALDRWIEEED